MIRYDEKGRRSKKHERLEYLGNEKGTRQATVQGTDRYKTHRLADKVSLKGGSQLAPLAPGSSSPSSIKLPPYYCLPSLPFSPTIAYLVSFYYFSFAL